MSPGFWTDLLNQTVKKLQARLNKKRPLRVALMGIGHELRGDDAVGLTVAQQLRPYSNRHFLVVEAGHAPENHTGVLRHFCPDLVLLVDSAQLDEKPGTIRWLAWQETTGLSASTHTMPPYMLARYLTAELNCEVALIGIQPAETTLDFPLSPAVEKAAHKIIEFSRSLAI
ncbi:MAG: hydrogenase 3 maturation endopeptidase HyCI [Candidatus Promineifilaceae bacterium]